MYKNQKFKRDAGRCLALVLFVIGLVTVIAQESAPKEQEKMLLRASVQAGGRYHIEQLVTTTMNGGKQEHTATQDFILTASSYGAEGKETLVRSKVDRVRIETNATADGGTIAYDSSDSSKQHPSLAAMAKGMAAITTAAVYDEKQEFKSFEGAANDEATSAMMKEFTNLGFPKSPVGPGDTWKHKIETNMGQMGMVKYDLSYTFTKMARLDGVNCALLAITGSMGTVPGAGANEGFDLQSRSLRGVMYFDPELGAVRKYEINSQLDLTAYGNKMPGSMTLRTVLKSFTR